MKLVVHADDFGLTRETTEGVLEAFDHGALTSTSIVANGTFFDEAMEEYLKRKNFRLAIHLNLAEGKPVSAPNRIPLLVNTQGELSRTFLGLWKNFMLSSPEERLQLKQQVKHELSAQILKVKKWTGGQPIEADGHLHYHMIPFIFDALVELKNELNISYIRLPYEKFFFCLDSVKCLKNYFGPNMIKHILLNRLSREGKKVLDRHGIRHCDFFIGVLFTGNMSESIVRSALSRLSPQEKEPATIEVLFHPHKSGREKRSLKELAELKKETFKNLVGECVKNAAFSRH